MSASKQEPTARILLVDDDNSIRETVTDILTYYGYDVHAEEDASDAVRWLQGNTPDLIVSDIMMFGMDGYEFFEAVRANPSWNAIPFVFLSAKGQQTDIRKGFGLGADAYVTKPFEPDDLLIAVKGRLKRVQEIKAASQEDMDRMKRNLVNIFGHELRTPLTYIYGYVNLLQDGIGEYSQSEVDGMLSEVRRGTDRLVKLTEDLMLMVQIDSGIVAMEIAHRRMHTNLNMLIAEVVRDQSVKAQARQVQIEANIPADLEILCVPYYLQDALARVIDNAIKFSARGSTMWINATHEDNKAMISVQDTGIGMEADQVRLIFEQFRQLNREVMEQQGVGLGLTITNHIITLHGGTLEVESEPNLGTNVRISLPA
jgi:two-component system, sensor histidine kinase and response regulator